MDDKDDGFLILSLFYLCLLALLKKIKKNKRWLNRRWWVRPINQLRPLYGDYEHLFHELKYDDPETFFRYVRMRKETFNLLLHMTRPFLTKANHRAFSPEQRLAITLRFFATGDQILSIALAFRCGESTVRNIIHETSTVIVKIFDSISTDQEAPFINLDLLSLTTASIADKQFPHHPVVFQLKEKLLTIKRPNNSS